MIRQLHADQAAGRARAPGKADRGGFRTLHYSDNAGPPSRGTEGTREREDKIRECRREQQSRRERNSKGERRGSFHNLFLIVAVHAHYVFLHISLLSKNRWRSRSRGSTTMTPTLPAASRSYSRQALFPRAHVWFDAALEGGDSLDSSTPGVRQPHQGAIQGPHCV